MLDHVSLPEAVGKALRHRILNNEIPADTRLVEANLAAEFGVSRGTIRDAMRSLQAEGLIAIVPRRYSVVTRMSPEDAEDVCFARYVLEDAGFDSGFGPSRKELVKNLRLALEHMSVAARTDDMDALVAGDTRFHELLIGVSGRGRLKDLPLNIRNIAWKAQVRLCARYRRLIANGKKTPVATTAIARELAAFLWAIGQQVAPQTPAA